MIDHVLGRPSTRFRKIQVFAVLAFWSAYLFKGNSHGPPVIRALSAKIGTRITAFQTTLLTLLWLYFSRNFGKICGLECPEPLAHLYSRSYFRATWITTALDAGFWTAMHIQKKWLRDLSSVVFSIYYLLAAEQADEKVRKVRATLNVEHLRVSWNKSTTPYLWALTSIMRPRHLRVSPRAIRIPRPKGSSFTDPVVAWLYYDGPLSKLRDQHQIVLDVPGGGFVAMSPRHHEDKLLTWAVRLQVPILSIDYRKAPEYPYPYALNESWDTYRTIMESRGRCIGLSGDRRPQIILSGDSAGANIAVGTVLMIIQANEEHSAPKTALPVGLLLIYPGLEMNIGSWMSDEQMSLINDRRMRKTNRPIIQRKHSQYDQLATGAQTPYHSEDEDDISESTSEKYNLVQKVDPARGAHEDATPVSNQTVTVARRKPSSLNTRLATTSMISYFGDRVLTPEMMRAMIILYVGPHNRPDMRSDYLLSPILAPENLLAQFPKTYFLTGERDPLVDDTVIFAGRIRQAKLNAYRERVDLSLEKGEFNDKDHIEISLIPGISHGFLQMSGILPETQKYLDRCGTWLSKLFQAADARWQYQRQYGTPGRRTSFAADGTPLQMGFSSSSSNHRRSRADYGSGGGSRADYRLSAESQAQQEARRELEMIEERLSRSKSLISLASDDDLLDRRMKALAGGINGGD